MTPTCIAGTYVDSPTLPPGVTNARLAGPGTITFSGDTVRFQGTRQSRGLGGCVGAIGFIIAIAAVIAITMGLGHFGLDLLDMQRGYKLVAVLALAAGVLAYKAGATLTGKLTARTVTGNVGPDGVHISPDGHVITLQWTDNAKEMGLQIWVAPEQRDQIPR